MGLSVEGANRLLASFRGYAQFGAGAVTALGLISAAGDKQVLAAVDQIYQGALMIVTGSASIWQIVIVPVGGALSVVLARWSSSTAKVANQALQVKAAVADPLTPIPAPVAKEILAAADDLKKQ